MIFNLKRMNENNFKEGSIEQSIFIAWDTGKVNDKLENKLMKFKKKDLAEFISNSQSKGIFGNGYIHP